MEKETNIIIRLSPSDKEVIQKKASAAGYSVSAYARQMLLHGNIIQADKSDTGDQGDRRNLVGIATNLNQLARHANSTGDVLPEIHNLLNRLDRIFDAYGKR